MNSVLLWTILGSVAMIRSSVVEKLHQSHKREYAQRINLSTGKFYRVLESSKLFSASIINHRLPDSFLLAFHFYTKLAVSVDQDILSVCEKDYVDKVCLPLSS